MANKFGIDVEVMDKTSAGLNQSAKSFDKFSKYLQNALKKNSKVADDTNLFNKYKKQFEKIEKMKEKKGRGVGGQTFENVMGNVGNEDAALAATIKQNAESYKEKMKESYLDNKSYELEKNLQREQNKLLDKEKKNTTEKGQYNAQSNRESDAQITEGVKGIGAGTGMLVGGVIAGAAMVYGVMSQRASAFREEAEAQKGNLQTLGFGAGQQTRRIWDNGKDNKYMTDTGHGFFRGNEAYMTTGQQQSELAASYGKQVFGQSGKYGMKDIGELFSTGIEQAINSYGLGAGQVGGWAGNLQRFGGNTSAMGKSGGGNQLLSVMGMAEKSGMGGSRLTEFMDAMQEAVMTGVQQGTKVTNDKLLESLGALTSVSDERLKAIAPTMLSNVMGLANRAASGQGGVNESIAVTAAMQGQIGSRVGKSFMDVRDAMQDNPLELMQDIWSYISKNFKGKEALAVFGSTMNMPGAQSDQIQQVVNAITGQTKMNPEELQKYAKTVSTGRFGALNDVNMQTSYMNYQDSVNKLSQANQEAAKWVNLFKVAVQDFVNGTSAGALNTAYGLNKNKTAPTKTYSADKNTLIMPDGSTMERLKMPWDK